jgi:uncharacterized low-complexity protein
MKTSTKKSSLALAIAGAFAAGGALSVQAGNVANPFGVTELSGGYMQIAEARCGEAKCGGKKESKDGSCGEGKCGGEKKTKEASCGEGKCGGEKKTNEARCGEAKCGGKKS